jgi:hypothetical protein
LYGRSVGEYLPYRGCNGKRLSFGSNEGTLLSEDEWQMVEQQWGWVFYGVHDSTLHALVTSGEGASDHLSTSMAGTPEVCNTNILHNERAIVATVQAYCKAENQYCCSVGVLHRCRDVLACLGSSTLSSSKVALS